MMAFMKTLLDRITLEKMKEINISNKDIPSPYKYTLHYSPTFESHLFNNKPGYFSNGINFHLQNQSMLEFCFRLLLFQHG